MTYLMLKKILISMLILLHKRQFEQQNVIFLIRDILIEKIISLKGNNINLIKTIINPNMGETKYWNIFDKFGKTNSLENNLIASLKGCISPINLTLFGPLRICL